MANFQTTYNTGSIKVGNSPNTSEVGRIWFDTSTQKMRYSKLDGGSIVAIDFDYKEPSPSPTRTRTPSRTRSVTPSISTSPAAGASLTLIGSVGAQNNSTWTYRGFTLPNTNQGRLVILYTSGTSFTGDIQFDDFLIGGQSYNPELGTENFQTNSTTSGTPNNYNLVSWTSLLNGTSPGGKFHRDASGTPSSGTGNTSGNTGIYYFYAETSSPGYPNRYFWLRSPLLTPNNQNVTFYSAQNGATCGGFSVYWAT